jgi:dolichol-phosphate mannosyltransferase
MELHRRCLVSEKDATMNAVGNEVRQLYRNRFSESDRQAKVHIWSVIVHDFLQRWVQSGDSVLDLGCGYGEFLNHIRCARRIGVDLNPDAPLHLDKGIAFHKQDVCELGFLPDACVDVVFTSNLMEHLSGKAAVEQMISEARRVLKPGGHMIALGPNLRFLPGAYWDFWDHVVPLTDRSLCEVLTKQGLEVIECYPRFLPYTTCSSVPKSPWLVRLYLKMPLAWRFMGRQFLIRARKR